MVPEFLQPKIDILLDDPKLMPLRAHPSDAGADLFSKTEVSIYPGEQKLVDTGVSVKIPVGFVGLVYNRSSQGKLQVIIPHSVGVIDSDYRGNIKVLLRNNGGDPYFIYPATTRIAQLVVAPIMLPQFVPFTGSVEGWMDTARGSGGFGSTN